MAEIPELEIRARLVVEGFLSGLHRSPSRGSSIEFAEHREYAPGDDLRYVDWKAYGKSDRIYLKQFVEETNLIVPMFVDVSRSMSYRSDGAAMSKLQYAGTAAAALAYLVIRQRDRVGLTLYDREVRTVHSPAGTPSHLRRLLQSLSEAEAGKESDSAALLHEAAEQQRQRALFVIFSDCFEDHEPWAQALRHLRYRGHEVIVFQIIDPAEEDFPFDEMTMFQGLESAEELLVEPRSLRKAYRKEFQRSQAELRQTIHDLGFDHTVLRTDMRLDLALSQFLIARGRRLQYR